MSEPYREGHEYVVCPECKSHILVSVEERRDRCEFSMPYDDEDPEAQYRQMRELGLVLPAEAADHYTGLDALSHATAIARMSPCKKSKRGVLVFNRRGPLGGGFNGPPPGFVCDGSPECRAACPKVCNHAEARALLEALSFARRSPTEPLDIVLHGAELLHIKVVDGEPVPSGPPSCWQCSRLILDCGISKVWLVHADGLKSYTADEFHEATLRECGLPVIREAAHG